MVGNGAEAAVDMGTHVPPPDDPLHCPLPRIRLRKPFVNCRVQHLAARH
jgi:hypothetical protein